MCGDCRNKDLVARLWTAASPPLRMIWSDPPFGVSYSEKMNWLSAHRSGPSRRPIENDSLKPDQLQKLFAMALEVSRQHAMPGAVIYATVPGAYLKYFISRSRRWRVQLSKLPGVGEAEFRDRAR